MDSPSVRHQLVVGELYHRLRWWIAEVPGRALCGIPVDVELDDHNVDAPDLWWCLEARRPDPTDIRLPALPEPAVDALSPIRTQARSTRSGV